MDGGLSALLGYLKVGAGIAFKLFGSGGMSDVFFEIASSKGRAAARAIADAAQSGFPAIEIQAAITLLRAEYEDYQDLARRPLKLAEKTDQWTPHGVRARARIKAATTSLTLAELYRIAGNDGQRTVWLGRADENFGEYSTYVVPATRHNSVGFPVFTLEFFEDRDHLQLIAANRSKFREARRLMEARPS